MKLFVVCLLALCSVAASADTRRAYLTHHEPPYTVYVERSLRIDPSEVHLLLTQLHDELSGHFQQSPAKQLEGWLHGSRDRFYAMTTKGGVPSEQASRIIGIFLSPDGPFHFLGEPVHTVGRDLRTIRTVVLHEATHQFHWAVSPGGQTLSQSVYYIEGLANYFSFGHVFYEGQLHGLSLYLNEWHLERAMDSLEARPNGLSDILVDPAPQGEYDPSESFYFMYFLIHHYPDPFRKWAERVDAGTPLVKARDTAFEDLEALDRHYARWLKELQRDYPFPSVRQGHWIVHENIVLGEVHTVGLGKAVLKIPLPDGTYSIDIKSDGGLLPRGSVWVADADDPTRRLQIDILPTGTAEITDQTGESPSSRMIYGAVENWRDYRATLVLTETDFTIKYEDKVIAEGPRFENTAIGFTTIGGRVLFRMPQELIDLLPESYR